MGGSNITSRSLVPTSSTAGGHAHAASLAVRWLWSKGGLALVSPCLAWSSYGQLLSAWISLRSCVGDVNGNTFHNVVLSTQGLGNLEKQITFLDKNCLLTSGSKKVMKAKARKGLGINTSVTSPNLLK